MSQKPIQYMSITYWNILFVISIILNIVLQYIAYLWWPLWYFAWALLLVIGFAAFFAVWMAKEASDAVIIIFVLVSYMIVMTTLYAIPGLGPIYGIGYEITSIIILWSYLTGFIVIGIILNYKDIATPYNVKLVSAKEKKIKTYFSK